MFVKIFHMFVKIFHMFVKIVHMFVKIFHMFVKIFHKSSAAGLLYMGKGGLVTLYVKLCWKGVRDNVK